MFNYGILNSLRVAFLKRRGLKIGKAPYISNGVHIDPMFDYIEIGDEVTLTNGVIILAHDASANRHLKLINPSACKSLRGKVKIGNRVFVGMGAIILPNVTVGDNAVIGAGSVVTHDVPAGVVVAGNPAKIINETSVLVKKRLAINLHSSV